jgi:hypothetical protein
MQPLASDLDTALAFVIKQVEEEAMRSGVLLDEDERCLLTHLPTTAVSPDWVDAELPMPVPRDLPYERLCKLTKAARVHDLQTRPGAESEWEFATGVLKLYRHPMSWPLKWAGARERDHGGMAGYCLALLFCS